MEVKMTRRFYMFFIMLFFSLIVVSGCGSEDEEADNENEPEIEEVNNEPEEEPEEEEPEEEPEEETADHEGSGDFASLIEYMEETTEGIANVLYENMDEQTHESDTITVTLNGYTLVELNDFHTNFSIPFDDETDGGGVIIAEYTIENTDDEDAYYMTDFYIEYTGTTKFHNNYDQLLPDDVQIKNKLSPSTDYLIEAGETVTGYYAYPFSPELLDQILDLSTVTVNVNEPHSEKGDVNSNFGEKGKFTLSLSEEGAEKAEASGAFYDDKATYDDMGEKTMIKEMSDINDSEMLRDVEVTLDGYQFTEFEPNEVEAPRFSNFTNGIVLLTAKFLIDNGGDEEIDQGGILSSLYVNDGSQYQRNESMLGTYTYGDVIEPGDSGEILQVYVLDQEQYEKIWKEKSFEIEIGPFKNQEAKDISKGNKVLFSLPE